MRDVVLEIVVALGLALLGLIVAYVFVGDRAWGINPDLLYLLGAFVFSVPAIILYERKRRRKL